jgi:hypothetical protein
LILREREEFLRRIEDKNVLNMPASTLHRSGSTESTSGTGKRKLSISSTLFKSFAHLNNQTESSSPSSSSPSGKSLHTQIPMNEISINDLKMPPVVIETPPTPTTPPRIDKSAQMMNTAVKLNALIKQNSGIESECRLVVCNLPGPSDGEGEALAYVEYLTTLSEDLPRVLLLKGTGTEVVTTYI